jgi:hypothetical protein
MSPIAGDVLLYSAGNWTAGTAGGGSSDNLGNHIATTNIQLGSNWLSGDGGSEGITVDASGQVGIGTASPSAALHVVGNINFTGSVNDISDMRRKENIAPIETALGQIMKLQAISFTMKDDPQHHLEYGFIAQDMQKIYPALVTTADDAYHTLSLNYMGLIAPLTRAMQEQEQTIREQQARIEGLERRLKAMESRYRSPLDDEHETEQPEQQNTEP